MPGTVGGDAGELQYAAPLLSLVHPTGQPLYVLLGYLWTSLLPLKSAAYEMNLLAAVSTAIGCGLLTWFIAKLTRNPFVAVAVGLTLGFGATLWGEAVLADKYGFNVLLSALIIGLALWWDQDHDQPHGDKLLYALSFAFALGLLHHRSLALFAVSIGILVVYHLRAELWRKWRRTLTCIMLVMLPPLIIYPTVLPALQSRDNAPLLIQPESVNDWVDYILERHVISGEALVFDEGISGQLEIYADVLVNDYTVFVAIVALLGMVILLRKKPTAALFLLVSFALQAILSANFRGNVRQFTYYLPSFVVLIYAYGYGLSELWTFARNGLIEIRPLRRLKYEYIIAPMILALPLFALTGYQFSQTYPDARERAIYGDPLDIWRQTLKSGDMGARLTANLNDLPENTALATDWEQVTILWYAQQVEGTRPDIDIFYPIERYADFVEERPVCLARHLPVSDAWHLTNIGAFICLNAAPQTDLPEGISPIGTTLLTIENQPVIEFAGYSGGGDIIPAGTHVPLTLYWQAVNDERADYSISLQLLDENWNYIWSRDIQAPVTGLYPTSRWTEGEVVGDYHELDIPRTLAPGNYRWTVVLYRQDEAGNFLQLRDAEGNVNILGGLFEVIAK
ncbi:MAG: DUF2723 domain-containing protein [Aggregatilineales bacterium]